MTKINLTLDVPDEVARMIKSRDHLIIFCKTCKVINMTIDEAKTNKDGAIHMVRLTPEPGHDHHRVFLLTDGKVDGFVGYTQKGEKHINVQRCGRCRKQNYVLAVTAGVCCWCSWDANAPENTLSKQVET